MDKHTNRSGANRCAKGSKIRPKRTAEAEEETADSSSKRHISKETSKLHTWTGSTAAYGKLLKN
jgi:hypothetical protein